MATATKGSKPSAGERERELEQAVAEAVAERNETEERARQHRHRINELKDRLAERQRDNPDDFDATGVPKPKTQSAKIAAEVEKLERADNYAAVVNGAQGRVERAEDELRRHRTERAREVLAELEPEAREAVARWMAWAAEGEAVLGELLELAHRCTRLVTTSRLWRGNAQTVPGYEHQSYILKLAREEPPLPLPGQFVGELEAEETEAEDE